MHQLTTTSNTNWSYQIIMVFAHDGCQKDEDSLNAITFWVVWKIFEKNVEMETQRIFVINNCT